MAKRQTETSHLLLHFPNERPGLSQAEAGSWELNPGVPWSGERAKKLELGEELEHEHRHSDTARGHSNMAS